jgi:3-oxoacyl-[acyl-carrier protein] reductase
MNSGILQEKKAIVFGAAGSIGGAVAKEFASEGAQVFVAGRTRSSIEDLARQIAGAGGRAQAANVDALDAAAVNQYIDGLVNQCDRIDIVFNATGPRVSEYGNGNLRWT